MDADSAAAQTQRKIELQSHDDLTYLITNVRNAAVAHLNEAFPQVGGQEGEDVLRNQIEVLVNEYIDKTFTLASPNLSINGLPLDPSTNPAARTSPSAPSIAYEPFDARKRQRVADLITQEEKLLEDVANLKRSVPQNAAAQHVGVLNDALKRDDESYGKAAERGVGNVEVEGMGLLDRQGVVEGEFRGAVEVLGRLKRDMSTVLAKMERARVAGEYVVDQRRGAES